MLEPHPPRREPRVFALTFARHTLCYAAVDPFEVRGVGELPAGVGLRLALSRVLLQTRPTVLVSIQLARAPAAVRGALRVVAARHGLPVVAVTPATCVTLRSAAPTVATIEAQYPEVRALRVPAVREALPLALAALATLSFPPRAYVHTYAATRLPARATPIVAPEPARDPRSPRLSHGPSARHRTRPEPD